MISQGLLMSPPAVLAMKIILSFSFGSILLLYFTTPYQTTIEFREYTTSVSTSTPLPSPSQSPSLEPKPAPQLPNIFNHGSSHCVPDTTEDLIEEAIAWNTSCQNFAPFDQNPLDSRIAKVMLHYGGMKEHYRRALKTHMLHSMVHNTNLHVLCDAMSDDWKLYNKQAFILNLLLEQVTLPEEERYEWLLYMDIDTIVLDQCRPISTFLPPELPTTFDEMAGELEAKRDHDDSSINLISTRDVNGLNDGIFFIRVSAWSVELLENVLAYRFYHPDENLVFSEQSAMEEVLKSPKFADGNVFVPPAWFNAYPNSDFGPGPFETRNDEEELEEFQARRGDWMMHFAGPWNKAEPMMQWMDVVERTGNVWEEGRVQRDVSFDVKMFWEERGYYAS